MPTENRSSNAGAPFQREDRYIVIKRSDLKKVPVNYRSALVDPMFSLLSHLPHRECLVIESDWPEFEPTWAAIEARVTGKPADDQADLDFMDPRRAKLLSDGRAQGLNEASELCARMGHDAYFPPGTRYKAFVPKSRTALGDLLIKAANAIADLPDGPYERFKARQAKQKA